MSTESTARDYLEAVQQRADLASGGYSWPRRAGKTAAMEVLADNARMRAALTAALDLHRADSDGDCIACGVDVYEEAIPWPCETIRAITDALTPKENDS